MTKSQLIKPENYCIIPVLEGLERDLKPDQRIKWVELGSGTVPIAVRKSTIRLWLDKMIEKVSTIGLRFKIKRRIK